MFVLGISLQSVNLCISNVQGLIESDSANLPKTVSKTRESIMNTLSMRIYCHKTWLSLFFLPSYYTHRTEFFCLVMTWANLLYDKKKKKKVTYAFDSHPDALRIRGSFSSSVFQMKL